MKSRPFFTLLLVWVMCLSLAAVLQPRAMTWNRSAASSDLLTVVFGEGRRLFSNHFFIQADVTFHSGYYPSLFDQARRQTASPMTHDRHDDETGNEVGTNTVEAAHAHDEHDHDHDHEGEHGDHDHDAQHEKEMAFLKEPKDWIEAFGRRFEITDHTHLKPGQEREILPWLRMSAALDPQRIETYIVSSFWLRTKLNKVDEAEAFLRDGLRANPNNPEILFELGRLYNENRKDPARARNLFELALRCWRETEVSKEEPDLRLLGSIAMHLARLEEDAGHWAKAIEYLQLVKPTSPMPELVQKQIDDAKIKLGQSSQTTP
jgi:hypothetical protein